MRDTLYKEEHTIETSVTQVHLQVKLNKELTAKPCCEHKDGRMTIRKEGLKKILTLVVGTKVDSTKKERKVIS